MAATVCHPGLQLHLETQLVESRTLRLRLPSPKQSIDLAFKSCFTDSNIKTQHHHHEENINININKTETFQTKPNNGGWNFLDALSNISHKTSMKETTTTTSYVHPQQKRSSLVLSPKSLEMCTENLGNESGTDIVENDMLLSLMGKTEESQQQQHQPCREVLGGSSKKAKIQNFPPPLTTIRGSESLRVRPHREDGRLVIEVTKVPPRTSCFEADRSHGRLRLCFSTNETREEEQEEELEEEDGDVVDDVIDENEELLNEEEFSEDEIIRMEIKDIEEEEEAEEELLEESGIVVACGESKDSESDVRMKKYERVRKCKEGGGESENNESIWMAATTA